MTTTETSSSTMTSGPLPTLGKALQEHDFVMVVFYRGHWCPFCQAWLRELEGLSDPVNKRNGKIIIVTAEDASFLPETRKLTGYTGLAISDPEHAIAEKLRSRGVLDVAVTSKSGYPNGMAQPAVIVMRSDRTPIYQWAIVPSAMNLGGAKDRPNLQQIVENVFANLDGRDAPHREIKRQTFWEGIRTKIFPFKAAA